MRLLAPVVVGLGAVLGAAAASGQLNALSMVWAAAPPAPPAEQPPRGGSVVLPPPAPTIQADVGTTYGDSNPGKIPGPPKAPGGAGKLFVNGQPVAEGRVEKTVPFAFSADETFDVGMDTGSAVADYKAPFPFTGTIQKVVIDLGK